MATKILCLDIETVRDLERWRPPQPADPALVTLEEDGGSEPLQGSRRLSGTVTTPLVDMFAPPYGWRPIVIGCVLLEVGNRSPHNVTFTARRCGVIDTPKAGVTADAWEGRLLADFARVLKQLEFPAVVTWNGRGFDLPVLMLRSMRYGIAHPWYYQEREPRYRYSEFGHCDLADHMADHGACKHRLSLDGMAKLIGLPGKFGDIDGAKVEEAFAGGRHDEIAGYCLSDAVQTAFLFLRWQLLKGESTVEGYQQSAQSLLAMCEGHERLKEFVGLIERPTLLLGAPGEPLDAAPAPAQALAEGHL